MKQGCLILLMLLFFTTPLQGDVFEAFVVGTPFQSGVGVITGPETSTANTFETAPFATGRVEATNARSILAGNGDVLFTAFADSSTELEFDMGVGLQLTTLDAALSYSEIKIAGIASDVDADNFKFQFTVARLDGVVYTDLTDLSITPSSGSISFTDLDAGLFEAELTGSTGFSEIIFTGVGGNFVRAVNFRSVTPDFETNELTVSGSRLLVSAVPEPGSLLFLTAMGTLSVLRRRRSQG